MKPTRNNTHGSRSRRVNPATGKRYDYETAQLEANAGTIAQQEAQAAFAKEMALLERQQIALKARDDLLTYTRFTMPDPQDPSDPNATIYDAQAFHIEVAKAMEAVERGEIQQLIFCMPPRHGKTELATKRFTAWLSGRHPEWNIAVGTYADSLAEDIGADVRNIMGTPQHRQVFPGHGLQKGGTSKSNMLTTRNGRLVFVGRGTGLTGKGANVLLIDDLYKDHEEARSQAIRDQAWNWFTKVAMTRRMGRKLVVITMTRWHSDDIVGRLTDPENDHYNAIEAASWKIIRLPAIAEDDDPLGREPGEPLWPAAFDEKFLASQQRIDPLGFAALYQQTPTVADGTLFRRETIQRYEPDQLPANLRFYATSDHAVGTKQRNDPSCFLKGAVDPQGNLWLTDMFWQRVPSDRAVEMMLEMGAGGEVATRPLLWWAERGHISKSIGPFLRKRMLETNRLINIQEVTPVGDKEQRAQSIAARVSLGKVYFPKGSQWDKAIEEMMGFPNGLHDDFVDALSLFGLGLTNQFGKSERVEKKEPRFGSWAWVKADQERLDAMNRQPAYGGF